MKCMYFLYNLHDEKLKKKKTTLLHVHKLLCFFYLLF